MVPLTTAANPLAARILAAHLGAEGIVWELRGNVDGPYPIGPVEVLVAEEDLAVAREVVVEQEVEPLDDEPAADHRAPRELWVLLAVVLLLAAVLFGRILVLTAQ
jgi:Putative prokaryotic signal transducing protein